MNNGESISEFLVTRLTPPPAGPRFVRRARLVQRLDQADQYALILVTGPAGSGKSSLLADWAAQAQPGERLVAWLSAEPEDNDPVRFWRYFTAALQRAVPGRPLPAPVLLPQLGPEARPAGLDQLCNALMETPAALFLILDNLQAIENTAIYTSLAYLLDHLPANVHLILAGRTAPPLPVARLRARGRLLELRRRELDFTEAEAAAFFQDPAEPGPSGESLRRAWELTQGWAAGLRLLQIALREDPQRLEAWSEGRRLAAEYLAGEVIDQLSAGWVDFLQAVAVPDWFTVELAAVLTGEARAAQRLEQMAGANLFLERHGDGYQLHPFFREALLQRLEAGQRLGLHRRAAAWFEAQGQPERAIPHALSGQDRVQASRLILQQAEPRLCTGEMRSLARWLEAMPPGWLATDIDLQVLQGWVWYFLGEVPRAMAAVETLEAALAGDAVAPAPAPAIQRPGWWTGLRCQMALVQENNRQALMLAQAALAETHPGEYFLRGLLLSCLATSEQALGDSEGAIAHCKQAIQANRRAGNQLVALFALINLGIELNEVGQRRRALELCSEALNDFTEADHPFSGLIDLLLARLAWEADQLDEAQAALDRCGRKLEQLGVPGFQISVDLLQVEVLAAREDYGEALRLTNLNRRKTRSGEMVGFRRLFDRLRAEIALKMGNLAAVEDWLDGADLPAGPQDDPARELEFLVQARYLLDAGRLSEAGLLLETLDGYARQTRHVRVLIATRLQQATLDWKKGDLGRTRLALEEALSLAAPQAYIRLLLDGGALLLGLLAQLPGAPAEIRARFRDRSGAAAAPELVEMLTAREIDVLRLLAENRTNAEIAQTLFLSPETVKVHLKHIFQKLDVADRRRAVRRAQELDLL